MENWILSIPAPSAPTCTVYDDFEDEFIESWTNTNEPYHASAELDKLRMNCDNIDTYITQFAKLARKVLYHKDDPAVLEKFKAGLLLELLEKCMHHDNPCSWDAWMRSTCVHQVLQCYTICLGLTIFFFSFTFSVRLLGSSWPSARLVRFASLF